MWEIHPNARLDGTHTSCHEPLKTPFPKLLLLSPIVVLAVVTLSKGIHWFVRARTVSAPSACINNLRQFDGAIQEWALEHKADSNAVVTWQDICPYIKLDSDGKPPRCSQGGTYTIGPVTNRPRCSIMWHNMDFGWVAVTDESGLPVADARVAVLGPKGKIYEVNTSTNGEGNFFADFRAGLWDDVRTNSWSDGTKRIVASKAGYQTLTVALPTNTWPLQLTLKKSSQ